MTKTSSSLYSILFIYLFIYLFTYLFIHLVQDGWYSRRENDG